MWNDRLSLSSSTYQTRDHVLELNSFVFVKQVSIHGIRRKGIITEEMRAMERLLGKSGAVVPKLINDLFGKGYRLFVDNWYASVRNQEPL